MMKYLLILFVLIFFVSSTFALPCENSFSVVVDPQVLKSELIDTNGGIHQKYIGQEGCIKFADAYFRGNMRRAFTTMSSMLSKDMFKRLRWQKFIGTTKEFKDLKDLILDETGELKKQYIGQEEGYPRFADTHTGGEMQKAFINVSSILPKEVFKRLRWQAFFGTIKEFKDLKDLILDEIGELREEYIGQEEGYPRFADTHTGGEMQKAFLNVSSVLHKEMFKRLGWQKFIGTTKEFKDLKNLILDEIGELEYIGQEEGYPRFADTHTGGEMQKTFQNVSSVLPKEVFKRLRWQQFQGTTKEFKDLKNLILDETGKLKKEYIGQEEGYPQFADTHTGGEMLKAFKNVSSVLPKEVFKRLGWQQFIGTTKEFKDLKNLILDETDELKKQYIGQEEGYPRFADTHTGGEMQKTFINVSSILSKEVFKRLGWQQFHGTTKEFKDLKNLILDETGELKKQYIGQEEGYPRFADTHTGGEMTKAFHNVSSVLPKEVFKRLGWQQFIGTTKEFKDLKALILDETDELKKQYIGQEEGYPRFADTHTGGEMTKAFHNVSSVLPKEVFKRLGWQQFHGTTKEFKDLKALILDETGELKKQYIGQEEGYPRFADTHTGGEMLKAFHNVSSILSKEVFKRLGWQYFHGTTKEFKDLKNLILDETGELKKQYIGQEEGYPYFADTHTGGEMLKAFKNVSSVLSKEVFKRLGWQQFIGTTKEFKDLKNLILDKTGELKKQYIGQEEGYPRFADTHTGGEMTKAFLNVSSVLSKEVFQQLGWKQFQGNANQFRVLITYFRTLQFEDYQGVEGQRQIAELIFENNLQRTYMNVSTLREYLFINKDVFKDLRESGWSRTLH